MSADFSQRELEPEQAAAYLKQVAEVQLVDVRQPDEHREARLAGARLIPLGSLPVRLRELDKQKPVLFYCAAGGRSGRALGLAEAEGFAQAKHIAGGLGAWAEAGLPCES